MHIVLGGTGHVGSALAEELLARGEPVTVVSRDPRKAARWAAHGAEVAIADVHDVRALRGILERGTRLFLLNPPADPSTDTAAEETESMRAILAAIEGSGLARIVAQSTYGARQGTNLGDLGVLHEMERELARQPIPFTIVRGAYYMSNWDHALETARAEGKVHSFYPADFLLPMVAPRDIGRVAADLMLEPVARTGLHLVEGPARYSPADVAAAFASALRRNVVPVEIRRPEWVSTLIAMGFSAVAARSFAAMTDDTLHAQFPDAGSARRGSTTLEAYIEALVARAG
jgi:uncharacterized protein YbjT (DUF2867 family)